MGRKLARTFLLLSLFGVVNDVLDLRALLGCEIL